MDGKVKMIVKMGYTREKQKVSICQNIGFVDCQKTLIPKFELFIGSFEVGEPIQE